MNSCKCSDRALTPGDIGYLGNNLAQLFTSWTRTLVPEGYLSEYLGMVLYQAAKRTHLLLGASALLSNLEVSDLALPIQDV
jgi:hypothetical protein